MLILCLVAGAMAFLRRAGKMAGDNRKLWHLWLFSLGAVLLGFTFTDRAWRWDAVYLWFWYPLALLSLPFSLPALYRWLKRAFPASLKGQGFLPTAAYFFLAALLYGITTGIVSRMIAEPLRADPVIGAYQIMGCPVHCGLCCVDLLFQRAAAGNSVLPRRPGHPNFDCC